MLVVGASGILAPLVARLLARGDGVTAVGRRPGPLAVLAARTAGLGGTMTSVIADTTTVAGAARVRAAGSADRGVLYAPATADATVAALVGGVRGRVVVVLTSGAADPALHGGDAASVADRARPRPGDGVVLLGWSRSPGGRRTGWHGPRAVSDAVAAVLDGSDDALLGHLEPWSERPR